MKKVFISTSEHFLIAADTIAKIEVVRRTGENYRLRITADDGYAYEVGDYDSEELAWEAANEFVADFGRVEVL